MRLIPGHKYIFVPKHMKVGLEAASKDRWDKKKFLKFLLKSLFDEEAVRRLRLLREQLLCNDEKSTAGMKQVMGDKFFLEIKGKTCI